jgi:transcriptional regulator with XRE-family HTH domain
VTFSDCIRRRREALRSAGDRGYSQRQLALRIGVQPSFLSKVERGLSSAPSEEKVLRLAEELDLDPDELLALAGKVASDLQETIRERPRLFGGLIRELGNAPDIAIRLLTDRAERGDW